MELTEDERAYICIALVCLFARTQDVEASVRAFALSAAISQKLGCPAVFLAKMESFLDFSEKRRRESKNEFPEFIGEK